MPEFRNPYISDSAPTLRHSVVAYIDILGYRELAQRVERENREAQFLQILHRALTKGRNWLEDKDLPAEPRLLDTDLYAIKAFTDNIVIGFPIQRSENPNLEITGAIFKVGVFQLEMIMEGFFIRGAISVGDAYIDDIVVFGKAFTEAYNGESELARDPRIILTQSTVAILKDYLKSYCESISPEHIPEYTSIYKDSDGQWFLNYLENILMAVPDDPPFYKQLEAHKEITELRLNQYRSRPDIWNKYFWAANYHNFFCSEYPQYFDQSHMIDLPRLHLTPCRIISGDLADEAQTQRSSGKP